MNISDVTRMMTARILLVFLLFSAASSSAQLPSTADGKALILSNDKLDLTIRKKGGALLSLLMKDDAEKISPLSSYYGHFICVDGFGPVSAQEQAAGLPVHGEATTVPWQLISSGKTVNTLTAAFSAQLPLVHESFRRTIHLVDGENVVYVESELENELAFDRPVSWGEHLTIGSPFLSEKTTIQMPAKKAMTRPYDKPNEGAMLHRLVSGREFNWPMAPGLNGATVDVRSTLPKGPVVDRMTSLMDTTRRLVFVTALNTEKHLLLGYVFRREEYPWLQSWEFYQADGSLTRGLEFAVQPFDLPRREIITQNSLFNTPTYRWLPAKSKIGSAFLMFWTKVPDGMNKVDDVVLENGKLIITDKAAGRTITLNASRGL